jgi:hypothetical protein
MDGGGGRGVCVVVGGGGRCCKRAAGAVWWRPRWAWVKATGGKGCAGRAQGAGWNAGVRGQGGTLSHHGHTMVTPWECDRIGLGRAFGPGAAGENELWRVRRAHAVTLWSRCGHVTRLPGGLWRARQEAGGALGGRGGGVRGGWEWRAGAGRRATMRGAWRCWRVAKLSRRPGK